jgi:DNA-3-methyladenine glycosylase II
MCAAIVSGQLAPTPPFDFSRSLQFLGLFTPTQREQTIAATTLTKALSLDGRAIVFEVAAEGSVDQPLLSYTLHSAQPLSPTQEQAALDRISFYLSLADDLRPFYAIGRADPAFAPVITQLYGYHQVKFLTPFENACWAVLSQRTPITAARKLKQTLIEQVGGQLAYDGATWRAFPEPRALVAAGPDQLAGLIGNERKGRYLHAVADAFASVDEQWLRSAPYAEVEAWLLGISGIGAWSAGFVLVRGLGRMEHLPREDRLGESAARIYGLAPDEASPAAIERLAQPYGAYRGYWAHYLRVAA